MQKPSIMRSLLWKDAKTLAPLAIAIWAGIFLFNFAAAIIAFSSGVKPTDSSQMLWVLMPNLMAIGAPAMLIGTEEESGTLSWLRSLPVAWQRVVDSKFLVALTATIISWALASLMVAVFAFDSVFGSGTSPGNILLFAFYSLVLLLLGFVLCYLFRSPVVALIVLVPSMYLLTTTTYAGAAWMIQGNSRYRIDLAHDVRGSNLAILFAMAATLILGLWCLQRWLGRRRLVAPASVRKIMPRRTTSLYTYRPPRPVGLGRPTQVRALLWQQFSQIGWATIGITAAASVTLFMMHLSRSRSPMHDFGSIGVVMAAITLGALVFYVDNIRRRCSFFADRGISPTRIWWTRLLWPALGCLVISLQTIGLQGQTGLSAQLTPYWIWIAFAAGQLVSMWVSRPVLTFFASPVYACLGMMLSMFFFINYLEFRLAMCLMVPILLFASWRLTPRWMAGKPTFEFNWRAIAYTAAAIFVPMLVVAAIRVSTTPSTDHAWRAKAMAATDKMDWSVRYSAAGTWFTRNAAINEESTWDRYDRTYAQTLTDELSDRDSVGHHVPADAIHQILTTQHSQSFPHFDHQSMAAFRADAIKIALRWSQTIRQKVVSGEAGLELLEMSAEPLERDAVALMVEHPNWLGNSNNIPELVSMIPSAKLRVESRKTALLREWRRFQTSEWKQRFGDVLVQRTFMGRRLFRRKQWVGIERRRSERYVDQTVALLWEQLDTQLPVEQSIDFNLRGSYWHNSTSPAVRTWDTFRYETKIPNLGETWTSDHEDNIRKLQAMYTK